MKIKSTFTTISISLVALALVTVFSAPLAAQKSDKNEKNQQIIADAKNTGGQDNPDEKTATTAPDAASKQPADDNKAAGSPKSADYWFDKGALCATYGNDRAAVKYFQKAISLDPNRSGAYFEQGISYGQLGDFDKAISLVNKAVEMEPNNGLYLYGRGRVYLLAGKQDQAMEDFKKAAELDDEDAQTYLKRIAQQ